MGETVIKVERLTKEYRLGTIGHGTLWRDLQSLAARIRGKEDPNAPLHAPAAGTADARFTALSDVSFEVEKGEVLGVIGRNGAGKSTLLKIISRVTAPTRGEIRIKGRVASLLEVGTGFHPDLTGRENIYLNGAILGMTGKEIARKFDEIVAFAEIEKFIDTPVKRYSSGMYVRLAFSVAAHLEPEILLIDEVLAVGDAQFQKKCLGKMEQVGRSGRTVFFVSHNMNVISALCTKTLYLKDGEVLFLGDTGKAVEIYNGTLFKERLSVDNCGHRAGTGGVRITDVWVSDREGAPVTTLGRDEGIALNLHAEVSDAYRDRSVAVGFAIDSADGRRIFTGLSSWLEQPIVTSGPTLTVQCVLDRLPLQPGRYLVSASVNYQGDGLDVIAHCHAIEIANEERTHLRARNSENGYLNIGHRFEVAHI